MINLIIKKLPVIVLLVGAVSLSCWFGIYFTDQPLPGWDLPGHIALVQRLTDQILLGNIRFYDRFWFSGWPAYEFYAPLSHVVAAVLSLFLKLFYADSARASVHYLLVINCALLPFSVNFLARSFYKNEELDSKTSCLIAFAACALSFWFLNHDHQWFGIGAAAVMHIGLFSQAFAWHLLLLHAGVLFREDQYESLAWMLRLALIYALLFLTHSLTAVFSLALAGLYFVWFARKRWSLFNGHLLAMSLCAFWLLPFLSHSPQFVGLDIHRPSGDILELFFRYPGHSLYNAVIGLFDGQMPFIDVAQIAVSFLFLLLVASMGFAGNSKTRFLLVLLLTLSVVFSSDFVASSIALGLHYYRFHAYVFLLLVASLATLPVVLGDVKSQSLRKGTFVVFLVSYLTIAVGPLILPHYERGKIQKSYKNQGLSAENRVLGYLESSPRRGRIFIEYNTDSNRFPFLSVHYLASEASRRTGFESLNGLFIQSSLAYRMPVASANLLGAKTFHIPLLFTDNAQLDDETKLLQLLDFGVTHIIAGSTAFSQRVADASNVSPIKIGPYFVFDLSEFAKATVTKVAKPIIGYVDLSETLPFKFVEFYFYSQRDLYLNYQLVDMSNYHQSRPDLSLWLVNSPEDAEFGEFKKSHLDMAKAPVLRSFFKESNKLKHFSVRYQHNFELDSYHEAEKYFQGNFALESKLAMFRLESPSVHTKQTLPELIWDDSGQSFRVINLQPKQWYRVNYSYFPYWQIDDGVLVRAIGERMLFQCNTIQCDFRYDVGSSKSWMVGLVVSILSLLIYIGLAAKSGTSPQS